MLDYPALRAVSTVVQTGSFEKAARVLNVTPSAVSQRVKQLEERLGIVLIERGSPCAATKQGEWLCRHMENVGMLEGELFERLPGLIDPAHPRQRTTLDIAVNADSLGTWFIAAASNFSGALPTFSISSSTIRITPATGCGGGGWRRPSRASKNRFRAADEYRSARSGIMRPRAQTSWPDILLEGVTLKAIGDAPALTFNQKDRLQSRWVSQTLGDDVPLSTHWLPSTSEFRRGEFSGMGWGMNPIQLVHEHLKSGRLVELVPNTPLDVAIFWQISRFAADRLAALTREVVAAARGSLHNGVSLRGAMPSQRGKPPNKKR